MSEYWKGGLFLSMKVARKYILVCMRLKEGNITVLLAACRNTAIRRKLRSMRIKFTVWVVILFISYNTQFLQTISIIIYKF